MAGALHWEPAASCFAALVRRSAAADSLARANTGRVFLAGRRRTILALPSESVSISGALPAWATSLTAAVPCSNGLGEGNCLADGVSEVAGAHFCPWCFGPVDTDVSFVVFVMTLIECPCHSRDKATQVVDADENCWDGEREAKSLELKTHFPKNSLEMQEAETRKQTSLLLCDEAPFQAGGCACLCEFGHQQGSAENDQAEDQRPSEVFPMPSPGKHINTGTKGVDALRAWTGTTTATIIFDSTVDEFTSDGLFKAVKAKPNIAIITSTTDGDVFGGFYSVAVTSQDEAFYDPSIFVFSFESHERCATPQRFVSKPGREISASVRFCAKDRDGWFVCFEGASSLGYFVLGNEKSSTWCVDLYWGFEGIENTTLTGNDGDTREEDCHHCARITAVQLM